MRANELLNFIKKELDHNSEILHVNCISTCMYDPHRLSDKVSIISHHKVNDEFQEYKITVEKVDRTKEKLNYEALHKDFCGSNMFFPEIPLENPRAKHTHFFTDLSQILEYLVSRGITDPYLIDGLNNTIKNEKIEEVGEKVEQLSRLDKIKIVNDINFHNKCAIATLGEVPEVKLEDMFPEEHSKYYYLGILSEDDVYCYQVYKKYGDHIECLAGNTIKDKADFEAAVKWIKHLYNIQESNIIRI